MDTAPPNHIRPQPGQWPRATIWIALLSLFAVGLLWLVVIGQARYERSEAITAAIHANENRAIAFEQYVIRTLDNAETATLYLIEHYGSLASRRGAPRPIDDPVLERSAFVSASVVDAQGRIIASTAPLSQTGQVLARQGTFLAHAANRSERLRVGIPRHSTTLGVPVISLTRRMNRADGSFGGIVGVQIPPSQFTNFYERADVSEHDLMSVIGFDAVTRARRTGDRFSFGENLTGFQVMGIRAANPTGNYAGPGGLDGILRYFSYRTLADYPLFVTVGVAQEEVLAPTRARHVYYYLGAGLLSLLILTLGWLLVARMRRREAFEIAMRDANARLREAQRIGTIGDWSYDVVTGEIIWSDQLYDMYERDPRDGPPTYDEVLAYFDEAGRIATDKAIRAAIETGEPQRYEQMVLLPSGRTSCRQSLAVADKDADGKVVRLRGTDQDISARKMLENLQAELAHGARFDAMNTMAATLAHELNQPLTAAGNYLAGIKRLIERRKSVGDAGMAEGIKSAEKQIHLAGNIIRGVRDMIADRSARYERAKLSDIIGDASSLVAMANDRPDMAIGVDIAPGAEYVRADIVQVQQILVNLIRNACEATRKGKVPDIRISAAPCEQSQIELCVTDNGTGIPGDLKDMFATFATSKKGGLGVGLSISRTIVEAHGGSIWVESTGKEGTAICFTLPADTPSAEAQSAA